MCFLIKDSKLEIIDRARESTLTYYWFIQNKLITIVHSNYKKVISSSINKLLRIVWGSQLPRAGDIAKLGGT